MSTLALGTGTVAFGAGQTGLGVATSYASEGAPGVLRELYYGDTDYAFHTFIPAAQTLASYPYTFCGGPVSNWPGGTRGGTLTIGGAVPTDGPARILRITFPTTGTVEEGLVEHLVNEPGGQIDVYINGQYYTSLGTLGIYDDLQNRVYDMRRQKVQGGAIDLTYGNGSEPFLAQSLFPAGMNTVEFWKLPNAAPGDTNSSGKATYFNGTTLYTRHPTFA